MGNTTTTLGAITPGEAANEVFDRYADWHNHFSPEVIAEAREYYTVSLLTFIPQQALPLAWAYAQGASRFMQKPDANKTGKLPSQLKQDVDELVGALREAEERAQELSDLLSKGTYTEGSITDQYMKRLLSTLANPKP